MYSVSAEFLTAMNAPVQEHKVKGTIGSYTFGPGNILSGSFFVTNQCSEQNMLGIGQVYIGELGATFRNVGISDGAWVGQIITPAFSLKTENGWEDVPLGVYTVAEATISASGVTVKAYDNMTKFDKALVGVIEDEYPYDVLSMACTACGVTLPTTRADIEAMANGTTKVTMSGTVETWRDVVAWMAQALGANATIDRSGYLRIFQYGSTSVATYDDAHRHSGASFADFVTRYTGISLTISATNTTYYYHDTPDDALTMELGANPFLQIGSDNDRQTACENILADLQTVQYSPFNVNLTGCPIYDLGDILTFEDGILSAQKTGCVTFFNYVNHAAYNIKGGGKNPAEASSKSRIDRVVGSLTQTVADQVNQMSVVQNAAAASIADGSEVSVLVYNFEVTEEDNLTMLDVSIAMTSSATETEAGDVYTLADIVAQLHFYVDGSEVNVYAPEFIVDEGKDTMTFNYSLSGLSVGAHEFDIRLEMSGGSGSVAVGDVHEMLWGYGITFEVYVKSLMVAKMPNRTVFYAGQKLDYTGVQIDAVYNNGLHNDVTAESAFDPVEETLLTQDDVGTITVAVEATVDDVDLDTSFDVIVKDGSWKGCAIYPGFRPYDNMWDWVKVSDFTKGSISVAYPGTAGLNDEDVVSYSRGWGSDSQSSRASFTGKGVYGNGNFSLAPNGKVEQYYFAPCLGGSMYWWEDGNDMVFARVDADSKNGEIGNEIISRVSKANYKANTLYNSGVTVPLYASTGAGVYGKVYILNTSDGTITPMHTFSTSTKNESVVLDDGSEYHFFHPYEGSSGTDPDKYLVEFKDGALSGHSLSIAGYYEYAALHYDATDDVLVLYLGNKKYQNSAYTYTTKCYKIDRYDYSVTEVTLPTSLIITQMDTSEDSSHVGYDTAEAVVLLNGTTTGQSDHSRYVYNGRVCVGNPVTQYNYGYFDAYNGKRTPQQFLMLDGWGGYGYYSANYKRIAYIDNLYFEESENNRIFLNVYHGL